MIDWIDESCKAWGSCTRWILADTNEGYPNADTIEKARQGLLSLGGARNRQFAEVRIGTALEVANAIRTEPMMPLLLTSTVWAQYVAVGSVRQKLPGLSRYLGVAISVPEYWRNLDRAHWFLAGRMGESR